MLPQFLSYWSKKFLPVVDNFMAYILWKFQADSLKIEAWPIQNAEEFLSEQKTRADLNFWGYWSEILICCRQLHDLQTVKIWDR